MADTSELDYESIENAVMETARGRWFLAEFKKRHAAPAPDTKTLLDAMARLEKVITSMKIPGVAATAPTPAEAPAGKEPAMPAKPASPQAAPAEPAADAKGDENNAAQADDGTTRTALSEQNMQYFKRDEDLFEAAPPVLDPPAENEIDEQHDSSPRFKVFKASPQPKSPASKDKPKASLTSESATIPEAPAPVMTPTRDEKDRIVIIRKSGGQDIDIPLQDEAAASKNETPDSPPAA